MDLLANLMPLPPLSPAHRAAVRELPKRMADLGYTFEAIREALGIPDIPARNYQHIVFYRRQLAEKGALGRCIGFFQLQEHLHPQEIVELLGEPITEALRHLNWLEAQSDGRVRSRVDLYPWEGRYLFTDTRFSRVAWKTQVYSLGLDSFALARCLPRPALHRSLDVCTGSGVHAVLAAAHSGHSWGVDINPRALQFSKVNAIVNSVDDHCEFVSSNCYAAVSQRDYDLITLNPPFVPTPDGDIELFRTGGVTGEGVTETIVRGLPERLTAGGLFAMYTEAPVLHEQYPLERMAGWLPPGQFGLAALYLSRDTPASYIGNHLCALPLEELIPEFGRWLDAYQGAGIQAMLNGMYYAQKDATFRRERWIAPPWYDYSAITRTWLAALATWEKPMPAGFQPRLHPMVKACYFAEQGPALVEFHDPCWAPQRLPVPGPMAELLRETAREAPDVARLGWSQEHLQAAYAELGRELVVTSWETSEG